MNSIQIEILELVKYYFLHLLLLNRHEFNRFIDVFVEALQFVLKECKPKVISVAALFRLPTFLFHANCAVVLSVVKGKNFVIKYEGSLKRGNSECFVLEHVHHDIPEALKKDIYTSSSGMVIVCLKLLQVCTSRVF